MIKYGVAYKLKKAGFILSFVILPTITFLVFYVYVNIDAFAMSFQLSTAKRFGRLTTSKTFLPTFFRLTTK